MKRHMTLGGLAMVVALLFAPDRAMAQRLLPADEAAKRQFISEDVAPLGPVDPFSGYFNGNHVLDIEWFASANDICRAFLALRNTGDPDAFELVDRALAASPGIGGLLPRWDRVWFKGGSEARVGADGAEETAIYNFAWFLEDFDGADYVVVSMTNDPEYGVDTGQMFRHNAALADLVGELSSD